MPRVPYELVVIEADRIFMRMVVATTQRQVSYYWELYIGYISACGWTAREFDVETLRRIDREWEVLLRRFLLN